MTENTFYTDRWREIDDERVDRYERMFVWREGHVALLAPLELQPGSRVLDYGCGPGYVTEGMGEIVGSAGRAYGVDLNARFVANASDRNSESDSISFHMVDGNRIPLDDATVDRLLCKNVLEYVPDFQATLAEFHRVLEPGGRLLLIDSDWGFVVVEPWGRDRTKRFFDAAAPAFKEPEIGRKLRTHALDAGFDDVGVRVQAGVDTEGGSQLVLRNMASYAFAHDVISGDEIDSMLAEAEAAIDADRYLFCLPQFLVTGVRPWTTDRRDVRPTGRPESARRSRRNTTAHHLLQPKRTQTRPRRPPLT